MAALESIRKRGPIVAGVIGFALLAFILSDVITSGKFWYNKSEMQVGEINGEAVEYPAFTKKFEDLVEVYKIRSGNTAIDDRTMEQLRNQVWEEYVNEFVMSDEYQKLGLVVSKEELFDLVQGKNIDPSIRQLFANPQTGEFNPAAVLQFLKNMDQDETGKSKKVWLSMEDDIYKRQIFSKYLSLISKGLYVTTAEAKMAYKDNSQLIDMKYVIQNFSTVDDKLVKVSDEDIKAYYEKNKLRYKQEPSRDISYVSFDILPSADDLSAIDKDMNKIKEDLAKVTDCKSFVEANSDEQYDGRFLAKSELPKEIDSIFAKAKIGTIYGPYRSGSVLKIAKIDSIKTGPDSVKARHILIAVNETMTKEKAKAKADSIFAALKKGGKFDELAKKYSDDPGSKEKGGDLGWFRDGMMVKPFNDACVKGKKGELKIVDTQFGTHIIEVTEKKADSKRLRLAIVSKNLVPSDRTREIVYAKANKFASDVTNQAQFVKFVEKEKISARVAPNVRTVDEMLPGMENAREFIRAAYKAKKADVIKGEGENPIFTIGDRYVIGVLTEVREKGIAPLEQIKNDIKVEVLKEKKAEYIIAQLNKEVSSGKSIDDIAALVKTNAQEAKNISFSSIQIPPAGIEPFVIGTAMTLQKDKVSKPIKGNQGVFVIVVTSVTTPPEKTDFKQEKIVTSREVSNRSTYQAYEALKTLAEIKDNRIKFF